jgi:hypothetical protein
MVHGIKCFALQIVINTGCKSLIFNCHRIVITTAFRSNGARKKIFLVFTTLNAHARWLDVLLARSGVLKNYYLNKYIQM